MAAALCWRPARSLDPVPAGVSVRADVALVHQHRSALGVLAACAGLTFVDGPWRWAIAAALAVAVRVLAARAEPPGVRRATAAVQRDLPSVVQLLAVALAAGASVPTALAEVVRALPGPASDALRLALARLAVGVPPGQVWAELGRDPALEPLGRALVRAEASGARVADAVQRLGDELARESRARVEDRARTVGIRAAVPLGVCLLPAFLLLGIVPVVVAAVDSLQW
jgi:pilus assembly protein TadC